MGFYSNHLDSVPICDAQAVVLNRAPFLWSLVSSSVRGGQGGQGGGGCCRDAGWEGGPRVGPQCEAEGPPAAEHPRLASCVVT